MVFTKYTFLYFPSHFKMACSKWKIEKHINLMSIKKGG